MLWEPAIYEHKAALIGKSPLAVACSAELLTQAVIKEYEVYQADYLTVGIDVYNIEAEACGSKLTEAGENECPDIAEPIFDLFALPAELDLPKIPEAGRFAMLLEAGQRVRDAIGDKAVVRVAASGPVTIATKLAGLDGVIMSLALQDGQADILLDFTTELCSKWCSVLRNAGLDVVLFDSLASPPMFSPDMFAESVLPRHARLLSELNDSGQKELPLILGGDTSVIVKPLKQTGATMLVCDYIADPAVFAANIGDQENLLIRRNINPARLGSDLKSLVDEYVSELSHFKNPVCGTGILPYDFNPQNYLNFRDAVNEAVQ
jgi:uroporphyrinogen decarboxylase